MQPSDNPEEPASESGLPPAEAGAPEPVGDLTTSIWTEITDLSTPAESGAKSAADSMPSYEASTPPPLVQPMIPEIMPEGASSSPPPRKTSTGVILLVIFLLLLCCCCLVSFVILWYIGDFLLTTLGDILNSIFGGGIQIY